MGNFPHWVDHILAFIFCVAIPVYGAYERRHGFNGVMFTSEQKKAIYLSGSISLFIMGVAVMVAWLAFKRPIAELGLTQPHSFQSWWWMVIAFILLYAFDALYKLASKRVLEKEIDEWKKRTPFLPTKKSELPEYILLCFSSGVFEELVYRGYLVNYCWYLFNGYDYQQLLSVLLPALVFSVAHSYQGKKAVLKIFILAIIWGYLFIYSGSLLIVMILHFLVDVAGGLLSIKYMRGVALEPEKQDVPVDDEPAE